MRLLTFVLCLSFFSTTAKAEVGDTRFGVSGPVMLIESHAYWGLNFTVLHELSSGLELGGETGFHIRSQTVGNVSASLWIVPIMPTLLYNFETQSSMLHPFVGVGLGIGLLHAKVSVGSLSASDTSVKFEGMAHVGAKFGEEKRFFTDIRLGLISDTFTLIPSIGWFF